MCVHKYSVGSDDHGHEYERVSDTSMYLWIPFCFLLMFFRPDIHEEQFVLTQKWNPWTL